jgi:signal transduction histidine kinase
MIKSKWYFHPLFVFIFSLIALGSSLAIYIRSYLRVNDALDRYVRLHRITPEKLFDTEAWVTILILSILVAIILSGMFLIYIYYRRVIILYRMQRNFISGFTHELKTPLASLKLFLETFSKYQLPRDEQLKYLAYMAKDVNRLNENVDQILKLGRLEDKRYKADIKTIDVYDWTKGFLNKTPHLFENGDIKFNKKDEGHYRAQVDEALFEMLQINLITNAFRYNDSEQATLEIIFEKRGKIIYISFVDNGIGIHSSELKNIFKKFYQVGKSAKGSGLGLYLATMIVKIHKGSLKVESSGKGEGSCFTLSIPLMENTYE